MSSGGTLVFVELDLPLIKSLFRDLFLRQHCPSRTSDLRCLFCVLLIDSFHLIILTMFPTTVRLSGKRMQIAHSQSPETGQSFLIVFCRNWRARSSLALTVRRWSDPRGEWEIKKGDWGSLEAEEWNVKSEREGRGAGCQTGVAKGAARHVRPPFWQIPLKMEHNLLCLPPQYMFLPTINTWLSQFKCSLSRK